MRAGGKANAIARGAALSAQSRAMFSALRMPVVTGGFRLSPHHPRESAIR
jgi:hypothetical protein